LRIYNLVRGLLITKAPDPLAGANISARAARVVNDFC